MASGRERNSKYTVRPEPITDKPQLKITLSAGWGSDHILNYITFES